MIRSVLVLALFVSGTLLAAEPALVLKSVNTFQWIYDDRGTGADDDLSIWRPVISGDRYNDGAYYSLGDVAMRSHGVPPKTGFVVRALKPDALAPPLGYTVVWDDSGSGGDFDVKFWKPIAPPGYVALGHVVVRSYSQYPSTDLIRCVKAEYVRQAGHAWVWDDSGSGADDDASIWEARPQYGDFRGQQLNTFLSNRSHGAGYDPYYVLDRNAIAGYGFATLPQSNADWQAMAVDFAPDVLLHPNEAFFPSDVDLILNHTSQVSYGNESYLEADLNCAICTNQPFLYGDNPSQHNVPMYAIIVPKNAPSGDVGGIGPGDQIVDIVYFMFYPYNRGKYIDPILWDETWYGNHVGDWEHLTVRFVNGRPHQLYLSQHGSGQTFAWGDKYLTLGGNEVGQHHAEVYSAQGSHALYAAPGGYTYMTINYLFGKIRLTDYTGAGPRWYGSQDLEVIFRQNPGSYGPDLEWLNYAGRWGNPEEACIDLIDVCRLENGPTGPMRKAATNPAHFALD